MASGASLFPPWPTTLTLTLAILTTVDKSFTLMDDYIIDIIVHIRQLYVAQYVKQQFKQRRCDHDPIEFASKPTRPLKLVKAFNLDQTANCTAPPPCGLVSQSPPCVTSWPELSHKSEEHSKVRFAPSLQLCPTQTHHLGKLVLHFKFELMSCHMSWVGVFI